MVHEVQAIKGEKEKVTTTSRKRKNKDRNLVGRQRREDVEVDLEKENGELIVMVWFLYCE